MNVWAESGLNAEIQRGAPVVRVACVLVEEPGQFPLAFGQTGESIHLIDNKAVLKLLCNNLPVMCFCGGKDISLALSVSVFNVHPLNKHALLLVFWFPERIGLLPRRQKRRRLQPCRGNRSKEYECG